MVRVHDDRGGPFGKAAADRLAIIADGKADRAARLHGPGRRRGGGRFRGGLGDVGGGDVGCGRGDVGWFGDVFRCGGGLRRLGCCDRGGDLGRWRGQDRLADDQTQQHQRGQDDQQRGRPARYHPPDQPVADQEMMAQRPRDMEQEQRDAQPGDQAMAALRQFMRACGQWQMGQGQDAEQQGRHLHLGGRYQRPAAQRRAQHEGVETKMHARRQRALPAALQLCRARLPVAHHDPQQGQPQYRDADRLVPLVQGKAPRAQILQRPADADLESEQGRDRPVQDDGDKAVAWHETPGRMDLTAKLCPARHEVHCPAGKRCVAYDRG